MIFLGRRFEAGGSFSWSTSSPRVTLSNTGLSTVTVTSMDKSESPLDVAIGVVYRVNGLNSIVSFFMITVQKPTSLPVLADIVNGPNPTCGLLSGGGWERIVEREVRDQFGVLMHYSEMPVEEVVSVCIPNSCGFTRAETANGLTNPLGTVRDRFAFCSGLCPDPGCQFCAIQSLTVNGIPLSVFYDFVDSCTGITISEHGL